MKQWLCMGLCALFLLSACEKKDSKPEQRLILSKHRPEAQAWIKRIIERHEKGTKLAAEHLAPGFTVQDDERAEQMRVALRLMSQPPKGISELIASPKSFVAAVDLEGKVIARDVKKQDDKMQGLSFSDYAPIKSALAGKADHGLVKFKDDKGGPAAVSLLFAHPASSDDGVVGVVAVGIPLWRLAQAVSQQLRIEYASEANLILWAYLFYDGQFHHFSTPPEVDDALPSVAQMSARLRKSPNGFSDEMQVMGRAFGLGVFEAPRIADKVYVVIVRSDSK
ncbi:MAG: hypothetical protein IPJ88_11670 [Myxococcales bacterium]|nr:MAG: hypothetical protein IPJ88_11670 [Myxococcales bacterium]